MAAPGSEVEIELDPTFTRTPANTDKSGGEGASSLFQDDGDKAITDDDIIALRDELKAAKAEAKRNSEGRVASEARASQTEAKARENANRLAAEVNARIADQKSAIESGLIATQGEIDSLRDVATKALEEGRWGDAAKAQEDMADAKLRLREFAYSKGEIARQEVAARNRPAPTAPAVSSKTQAWIASHPRFNTDSVYRATALLAHEKAVTEGIPIDSDEYFERVEMATGDRTAAAPTKEVTGEGEGERSPTVTKQSGVAPVTRRSASSSSPSSSGRQTIKLSGDQVEAADSMFGDPSSLMYIKDPKERYTYWHTQQERLKAEGRM